MALSKQFNTRFGVQAGYHKITALTVDRLRNTCHAILGGFVDRTHRDTPGAVPVIEVHLNYADLDLSSAEEPQIYDRIKALPDWEGAEDC